MLDPNNQNYFSLNEQPSVILPWWKVKKNQMHILAVFGVIVGVGLVGYYAYQTYSLTHVDVAKVEQANGIIASASSSCATDKDPAACESRARSNAARATGQTTVCEGLVEKKYMNCVMLIALDTADPTVCVVLSGTEESVCTDSATLRAAKKAENYGMCAVIIDETKKSACQSQLLNDVVEKGECEKYGIDISVCEFPVKLEAVITSGNPDGCTIFSGGDKSKCDSAFLSIDEDKDGLSLSVEYTLGTSDTNADTDGDGYTDAQEVASGHDLLK